MFECSLPLEKRKDREQIDRREKLLQTFQFNILQSRMKDQIQSLE